MTSLITPTFSDAEEENKWLQEEVAHLKAAGHDADADAILSAVTIVSFMIGESYENAMRPRSKKVDKKTTPQQRRDRAVKMGIINKFVKIANQLAENKKVDGEL